MIDQSVIDRITSIIDNLQLPDSLRQFIFQDVSKNYDHGVVYIEKVINQNIINTNPNQVEFLQNYSFDLIKNMNTELNDKLKAALKRNILEGKSYKNIVSEVQKIFKSTVTRAKAISRTETVRAYALGQLEAARLSPIKTKKYILAVHDKRLSPLCRRLSAKYDKAHAIDIEKKFYDKTTGESWLSNPFHTNCRSVVVYTKAKN